MSDEPNGEGADAAVLIVNYNSGGMLRRCLDALGRQTLRGFELIVVDNASSDGSADGIEARYPGVVLVQAGRNAGFAEGNNIALRHVKRARWIVLLNPDAFAEPQWLDRFVAAARARPEFTFFGCRMVLADDPQVLDGTGDVYHVSGASWRRDHGNGTGQAVSDPGEIFGPCAAAALYSRAALAEVGGFDESYFCYHEDVDLAFRLRLRGHRCWYVPEAVVHHVSSGIAGKRSAFATYHGHRNLVWTYVKDMPALLFWSFLPLHLALNVASIAVCAARGQLGVVLRAKRDALRGLSGALRQRRDIQARRTVGWRSVLAAMQWGVVRH